MRACYQSGGRTAVLEQLREHGLAGAGLSDAPEDKAERADELRASQTDSELILGQALIKVKQWAFYAQVPLHGYIVDFYAPEVTLAVEVDGASHNGRQTADQLRDDALRAEGIQILRFTADQVVADVDAVVAEIKKAGRKRRGRGARLGEMELDYYLFRHGLTDIEPELPPSPPDRSPEVPSGPKAKFRCLDCERDFVDHIQPPPKCRANRNHKVRGVCSRCRQPRAQHPPICGICRDAADVARESAGPGAHAPGDQLGQARRAQRWRGR